MSVLSSLLLCVDQQVDYHRRSSYFPESILDEFISSHHSTRDPNHPPRHHTHHHLHHHHHHHNQGQQIQNTFHQSQPSSQFFPVDDVKEGVPQVSGLATLIHFGNTFQDVADESQHVSTSTQRKRKDLKTFQCEHTDTKRISRSSSEVLKESSGIDMPKRSLSEARSNIDLFNKFSEDEQNPEVVKNPAVKISLIATEEDTVGPVLEYDRFESGSIERFDRDFSQTLKSRHSQDKSPRCKRSSKSRSSHESVNKVSVSSAQGTTDSLLGPTTKKVNDMIKFGFDNDDSLESSLSSSPGSASLRSNSSENDIFSSDEKDVDVQSQGNMCQPQDTEVAEVIVHSSLRRSSWESSEPPVQDHMQQTDNHQSVISWIPHMNGMREVESFVRSDEFSARHLGMLNSQKHLDPTHMQRLTPDKDSNKKSKLRQLNKMLKTIKRKMDELDIEFETQFGYKPSHADKQKQETFRILMADQLRLRKQIQACKESDYGIIEDVGFAASKRIGRSTLDEIYHDENFNVNGIALIGEVFASHGSRKATHTLEAMTTMFHFLQQKMEGQRSQSGRPCSFHEMTAEQLLDEKNALRSVLYQMEETFGYPTTEDEKNVTKDVFERYRTVKRLIRKNSATFRAKESGVELETIPEDIEIPLTLASPQHRILIEVTTSTIDQRASEVCPSTSSSGLYCQSSNDSSQRHVDRNLHAMSRSDLLEAQRRTREEKKHYRRIVKEKEDRFLRENALRRVTKDERQKIDEINYNLYKKSKAKLKLIEALLSKGR